MALVSAEEVQRRRESVASTLGTHAMEGLSPDTTTSAILARYEDGDLTLEQFSAAMDTHAKHLLEARHSFAGAA